MSDHIERVVTALEAALEHGPAWGPSVPLEGLSGARLIGALQRLAALLTPAQAYVEVGVYRGATLLSVAGANPGVACFGIDNFAFFDHDGQNRAIVETRRRELGASNAAVIDLDYEDALEALPTHIGDRHVGLFFVDGPHDYRSQLMCLELIRPWLADEAVVLIDDCNYGHVRQANRDFLRVHPELKLAFEAYTPAHPKNLTGEEARAAREGWWNGVNVLVTDPEDRLAPAYPPTERNRTLFENEHLVHAMRAAELAPRLVQAFNEFRRLRWDRFAVEAIRLLGARTRRVPHATMNTYSEALPRDRFTVQYRPGK